MKLKSFFHSLRELRHFLLLFTTQALSSLGSAMTSYALVIWAYQQSGSALSTAAADGQQLRAVCRIQPVLRRAG